MKRWRLILLPWALCSVTACGLSATEKAEVGDSEALRTTSHAALEERSDRELIDRVNGQPSEWTKWEKAAGRTFRETPRGRDEVVNAYPPPGEEIAESAPIYNPQEPDLCDDFYYELCEHDLDCQDGFVCGQPTKECQPSACGCDPDTGDAVDCTRDCVVGVGRCEPGEREDAVVKSDDIDWDNDFITDLSCDFLSANPNPMSYCESGLASLTVTDANEAPLPPGCVYEIRTNSSTGEALPTTFQFSGYTSLATAHEVVIQHLSIGNHKLCFQTVRVCDATYVDADGNTVDHPFAGETEQCDACLDPAFQVILPELDGEYCGMNEAQWHQEFLTGTNCIDASSTNQVFIDGTPEDDLIVGNNVSNVINGRGGDDCIDGRGESDRLDGGRGNDFIVGGSGNDRINGGWGLDYVEGGDGDDNIKGSLGPDVLKGNAGRDYIRGDSGDDTIEGGAGDDELKGEWGRDYISGGDGNDVIYGGWGKDSLYGDAGRDKLKGGPRADVINGNEGADFLMGDSGRDNLSGGVGADRLCGNWGRDTLNGDADTDRCNGGPGADVEYSCEHTAHESACTERAFDQGLPELPNIEGVFCGVDASVWLHEFENGAVGIIDDRTGSNVNITGTSKRDLILGNSQNNRIRGNGGNDCIYGYDGDDDIDGELGNDDIYGGNGNDKLKGGWGTDRIYGEAGADQIDGDAGDDILYGGAGNDSIKGGTHNDTIHGGDGADTIRGDAGNDLIYGGNGNDQIDGELGNDTIYGQAGNDSLKGGWGDDRIYGQDGRDKLKGELGNDYLYGGSGHDLLMGDGGGDRLYGESGNDRLCGNTGGDYLNGGANSDACRGGWGSDTETQCESNASSSQCTDSAWNSY